MIFKGLAQQSNWPFIQHLHRDAFQAVRYPVLRRQRALVHLLCNINQDAPYFGNTAVLIRDDSFADSPDVGLALEQVIVPEPHIMDTLSAVVWAFSGRRHASPHCWRPRWAWLLVKVSVFRRGVCTGHRQPQDSDEADEDRNKAERRFPCRHDCSLIPVDSASKCC